MLCTIITLHVEYVEYASVCVWICFLFVGIVFRDNMILLLLIFLIQTASTLKSELEL